MTNLFYSGQFHPWNVLSILSWTLSECFRPIMSSPNLHKDFLALDYNLNIISEKGNYKYCRWLMIPLPWDPGLVHWECRPRRVGSSLCSRGSGLGKGYLPVLCHRQVTHSAGWGGLKRRKNKATFLSYLLGKVLQQQCSLFTILEVEGGKGKSVLHFETQKSSSWGCGLWHQKCLG